MVICEYSPLILILRGDYNYKGVYEFNFSNPMGYMGMYYVMSYVIQRQLDAMKTWLSRAFSSWKESFVLTSPFGSGRVTQWDEILHHSPGAACKRCLADHYKIFHASTRWMAHRKRLETGLWWQLFKWGFL